MLRLQAAIRAQNLVKFDYYKAGAPGNFQEKPLLKTGYFFYRHTSEIGSFRSLTNLTLRRNFHRKEWISTVDTNSGFRSEFIPLNFILILDYRLGYMPSLTIACLTGLTKYVCS